MAARADATGRVGMSIRSDPERSGAVEVATREMPSSPVSVGLARAKKPGYGAFPPESV